MTAQAQYSLTEQLAKLSVLGIQHGLYDAVDWLTVAIEAAQIRRDEAVTEPFLLMNDDATVTPLTRCHDCGFLFRDIEKHVAESVTVRADERPNPCCLTRVPKLDFTRLTGDEWRCDLCGTEWVWDDDEAEGGAWWPKITT